MILTYGRINFQEIMELDFIIQILGNFVEFKRVHIAGRTVKAWLYGAVIQRSSMHDL